jgi:hypothetical protein
LAPYLPVLLLLGLVAIWALYAVVAVVLRDRVEVMRDQETCPARRKGGRERCGYPLAGLGEKGVCPECGTPFERWRFPARAVAWRWERVGPAFVVGAVSLGCALVPLAPLCAGGFASPRAAVRWRSEYWNSWPEAAVVVVTMVNAWMLAVFVTRLGVRFWGTVLAVNLTGLAGAAIWLRPAGVTATEHEWIGRAVGLIVGWVVAAVIECLVPRGRAGVDGS